MIRIHLMSLGLAMTLVTVTAEGADGAREKGRYGRFSISYNLNFNVSADFSNIGGPPPGVNPLAPLVAPGDTQQFDDGFIGVDVSGNAGGMTTFWGYDNASQVAGGSVVFSSTAGATGLSTQESDSQLQHGLELTYNYQIKGWNNGGWGIEGAFGWMPVGINDNQSISGPLAVFTGTFTGIIPVAPYDGPFSGPGLLLDVSGPIVQIPNGTLISGRRDIDASVFAFRFGPYLDYYLTERVSLTLSAGLTLAVVDSEFSFNELRTPIIGTPQTTVGQDRSSDLLVGGYLSARLAYWFTDNCNIFTGVSYQNVGSMSQSANGRDSKLDLGKTIAVNVGVGFSF